MGSTVTEPDIAPLILQLFSEGLTSNEIDDKIIQFFTAYDQSTEN